MTLRTRAALLAAAAVAALATGCGSSDSSDSDEKSATAKPQRGGTLTIATAHDITSFDQFSVNDNESIRVISQVIEGLYKTDADGKLVPWLATGDEVSADGLTHTLTLREGVKFSDGKPLTAADVKFSLEQARDSKEWGFAHADLKSVKAQDDRTVVLRLAKPVASLHANLALFVSGIIPADYGGRSAKEFARSPIGTGPFVLERWDRGTRVTLARNPHYWQKGRPLLDGVDIVGVPDDNSRITQLRGKQVDVAARPPWPQLDALDRTPGLSVETYALAQVDSLNLNTKKAPFDDKRLREAVDLALDREGMVKASLSGRGEPARSFLAPSMPFYSPQPAPAREEALARAKQLVQEAGAPRQEIEVMFFNGNTVASTVGQILQENLKAIGLKVKLLPLDQAAVLERGSKGDYNAALSALTSDIVDPAELAAFYVGTNGFSTFSNPPELADLVARAAREEDRDTRAKLYAELQRKIAEQHGFLALQVEPWVWAMSDRVQGFTVNATGIFDLSTVGVQPGT